MKVSPTRHGDKRLPVAERLLVDEITGATMLSLSRVTFRRFVNEGFIKPVELPIDVRRNLYRREDLERFARTLGVDDHAVAAR